LQGVSDSTNISLTVGKVAGRNLSEFIMIKFITASVPMFTLIGVAAGAALALAGASDIGLIGSAVACGLIGMIAGATCEA
jgi:hypothetical protein